ncbi:GbsR/MarR family transcriptional regulator [Guptibacillus hwajinpoensis]|uniref:HTH-type transcriptional regulator n=1 Tax=Guptibacillus hwajinpoensis TaxID=208199 RepID=A0ABU0K5K7_9BACL|nr:GbsR/MarR family transcriptional regulator [Alkalihalobacillus hemicentroti]MDQ0484641.1 DNA-binding transcriptional regulator GbsR (MarR family) [Alkalihalobacillus hemicentroti]
MEDEKLENARERVIESISKNMDIYSVTPSVGRLYGAMFFEKEPMTLDEMKDKLQMSKTSMSTGVRTLIDLNMIEKVWRKGERKDLYEVKSDWYQTFTDFFCIHWRKGIEMNRDACKESITELMEVLEDNIPHEKRITAQEDLDRMSYALGYYEWLNKVVDLFESREIFDVIDKGE